MKSKRASTEHAKPDGASTQPPLPASCRKHSSRGLRRRFRLNALALGLFLSVSLLFVAQPVSGSGVTIIAHGFQLTESESVGWIDAMAQQIASRAGDTNSVSILTFRIGGHWENSDYVFEDQLIHDSGPVNWTDVGHSGEVIIKVNWSDVAGVFPCSTEIIALRVWNLLMNHYLGFPQQPLHLIGHSRGASVVSVLSRMLGEQGIWVDQTTFLDPHPWSVTDDADVLVYDNVIFADNYYENYLCTYPAGVYVDGTAGQWLNPQFQNDGLCDFHCFLENGCWNYGCEGICYPGVNHARVHDWFHGTIDNTATNVLDSPIPRSAWYSDVFAQGFAWSRLGGKERPGNGLKWVGAHRQTVTRNGTNWPNVAELKIVDNRFSNTLPQFQIGEVLPISYIYQSFSNYPSVYVYLDADQNPYNVNSLQIAGYSHTATSDNIRTNQFNRSISGIPAGKYYLYAKIQDAYHTRYAYAPKQIELVIPAGTPGSDFSGTIGTDWSDLGGNSVIEGNENVGLRIRLTNSGAQVLSDVSATLSSSVSALNIWDSSGDYSNSFNPGDSQWGGWMYMKLNQASYDNLPLTLHVTYKMNGLPYYQDFIFTQTFYPPDSLAPVFAVDHVEFNDSEKGNGDGILQSGERSDVIVYLKNVGNAPANHVDAYIANPSDPNFEIGGAGDNKSYPDLPAGGAAQPPSSGGKFFVRGMPYNFTGTVDCDMVIRYGFNQAQQVISNSPLFNVQPAKWMQIEPEDRNFGVTGSDSNVVTTLSVHNIGSTNLQVSSIATSNPDTVVSGSLPPWDIPVSESRTVTVTIQTSDLLGEINREVTVNSNARNPQQKLIITGMVADAAPSFLLPGVSSKEKPDVSGETVVWVDHRNGNTDIYRYNLMTGQEFPVCTHTADQDEPRVAGNIVAWEDLRNSAGQDAFNWDIYAYDLSSEQEISISTDPKQERLIGVDNGKVAFARADFAVTGNHNGDGNIWNVYLYDIASGSTVQLTSYVPSGTNPVQTAVEGDFGGGILAWNEAAWLWDGVVWNTPANNRLLKFEPGVDSAAMVVTNAPAGPPSVNNGRIAWRQSTQERKNVQLACLQDAYYETRRDGSSTGDETTHGGESLLYVASRSTSVGFVYGSLLQFDISQIAQDLINATVISAKLNIYQNEQNTSSPAVEMQRVTSAWQENQVNSVNHPTFEAVQRDFDTWYTSGWITKDLPDIGWITTWAGQNYGLVLRPWQQWITGGVDMAGIHLRSKEYSGFAPYLEVVYDTAPVDQWWTWEAGNVTQLTQSAVHHRDPILGDNFLVTEKEGLGGKLFYWNFGSGAINESEASLLALVGDLDTWRADENVVVWRNNNDAGIHYAYVNQPDVSISSMSIVPSVSELMEEQPFHIHVEAKNLSNIDQSSNVVLRIFTGNPDSGGTQIDGDKSIVGGISGRGQAAVTFSNIVFETEGSRHLYARLFVTEPDNPVNNTASLEIDVQDADILAPILSNVAITEFNGDGDGLIGSDEQFRIRYDASDPSGLSNTWVYVDGAPLSVFQSNGSFFATAGPLAADNHQLRIIATDGDNSPESTTNDFSFAVLPAERIAILYNGVALASGSNVVVNVSTNEAGSSPSPVFVVRNEGQQLLALSAPVVTGAFSIVPLSSSNLGAGEFAYFSVLPDTATLGSYTGMVSLANGDLSRSPFVFNVVSRVVDTTAPFVVFTNPTSATLYLTTNSSLDIGGIAADNVGVVSASWSNDRGGSGPCTGTTNWSRNGITLLLGTNILTVVANDGTGNIGSNTLTAIYGIEPVACFTASPTNGNVPLPVTFTDCSSGIITNRFWNFGDGNTTNTSATNVQHTYGDAGTNTVTLVVSGPLGSSTNTKPNFIFAINCQPPVAGLSPSETVTGGVPLVVNFSDDSSGNVTGRTWNFGDGSTSSATNPSYSYTNAGTFSVSLTVFGSCGSNTLTRSGLIVVTNSVPSDAVAPTVPANVSASAMNCTNILVSWNASADSGGSGLAGYKVYRGGAQIGTTTTTNYTDTGRSPSSEYCYTVAAYDNATNTSAQSSPQACATTPDCGPCDLAQALDQFALNWSNVLWECQSVITNNNEDAAISGEISDGQTSWFQTSVTGPGTLKFWWKVSSETNFDRLTFAIDEVEQSGISGEVDWLQKTFLISSNLHILTWAYSKNESASQGDDAGFVDQVEWEHAQPPPGVSKQAGKVKCKNDACTLTATFKLVNNSLVTFGPKTLYLYLSDDTAFDSQDSQMSFSQTIQILPGKKGTVKVKKVSVLSDVTTTGKYALLVCDPETDPVVIAVYGPLP